MTGKQKRHLAGEPASVGGRFAPDAKPEADLTLTDVTAAPGPILNADVARSARQAPSEDIWHLIDDPNIAVRSALAYNPNLTGEQVSLLVDPTRQPPFVRREVSQLWYSGLADVASTDPDVVVRIHALHGWDLSAENRQRLESDPEVRRVLARVAS